ncbi:glycosyl hydrolase 53 family protein [Flavobacterium sp.]|uniref:glycoside hydrolase family 53 protein n=1 Tax=Flavobacterium sp. TaxID=239 RepID=UPI00261E25BC|nr:glycosyl hydrolase 53 family protein [Flavobacterium sp.]
MKKIAIFCLAALFAACSSENNSNTTPPDVVTDEFIRGADMSFLPLIESEGTIFKNNNVPEDPIITLKNAGCNYIRIRIWNNPETSSSSFQEVKTFADRVHQAGLKVWLTVHYSDTWADPGHQTKPQAWQNMNLEALKTAVASYTTEIMTQIKPDLIQIGNETNDGMLWPEGRLSTNEANFKALASAGIEAVRAQSTQTKIMLHFAGMNGSDWFFEKVKDLDYDYIGLSYYPIWHGKSLSDLMQTMNTLGGLYNKKVVIAETAYPFTLGFNDFTNNIMGLTSQLIPAFAATESGQSGFMSTIYNTVNQSSHGIGFCYWGAEWVAFRGNTASNGSSWENQALWDFNNNALPVMTQFRDRN